MIVFHLFFQPSDLLGTMEPAANGFSFLFTGIQGIGAGQNRVFLFFEFQLFVFLFFLTFLNVINIYSYT